MQNNGTQFQPPQTKVKIRRQSRQSGDVQVQSGPRHGQPIIDAGYYHSLPNGTISTHHPPYTTQADPLQASLSYTTSSRTEQTQHHHYSAYQQGIPETIRGLRSGTRVGPIQSIGSLSAAYGWQYEPQGVIESSRQRVRYSSRSQERTRYPEQRRLQQQQQRTTGISLPPLVPPFVASDSTLKNINYWRQMFNMGVPIRILVPENWTGHIVGRGGHKIQEISHATQTMVQVVRDHYIEGLVDKIVFIYRGTREARQEALAKILSHIRDNTQELLVEKDGKLKLLALIPDHAVSFVIGIKGSVITKLSQECKCEIRILSNTPSLKSRGLGDKIFSIRSDDIVNVAKGVIRIHDVLQDLYNKGRLSEMEFIFALRPGEQNEELETARPAIDPKRRKSLKESHRISKSKSKTATDRRSFVTDPSSSAIYPRAFIDLPHLLKQIINNTKDETSLKFITSKLHAAWIIGNDGQRKNYIESQTGVTLKIHNSPIPSLRQSEDDRALEIRGHPMGVAGAVNLCISGLKGEHQDSLRMVLPKRIAGIILTTLSTESQSEIGLLPSYNDKEMFRLVTFKGSPNCRVTAILLILQRMLDYHKQDLETLKSGGEQEVGSAVTGRSKRHRASLEETFGQAITSRDQLTPPLKRARHLEKGGRLSAEMTHTEPLVQPLSGSSRKVTIPAESIFLQRAVTMTYPKVITTAEQFTVCVSFSPKYRRLIDDLGPLALQSIQRNINSRVGSSVRLIESTDECTSSSDLSNPLSDLETMTSQVPTSSTRTSEGEAEFQPISTENRETPVTVPTDVYQVDSLHFAITGTPTGNCAALLLLHEALMNLETFIDRRMLASNSRDGQTLDFFPPERSNSIDEISEKPSDSLVPSPLADNLDVQDGYPLESPRNLITPGTSVSWNETEAREAQNIDQDLMKGEEPKLTSSEYEGPFIPNVDGSGSFGVSGMDQSMRKVQHVETNDEKNNDTNLDQHLSNMTEHQHVHSETLSLDKPFTTNGATIGDCRHTKTINLLNATQQFQNSPEKQNFGSFTQEELDTAENSFLKVPVNRENRNATTELFLTQSTNTSVVPPTGHENTPLCSPADDISVQQNIIRLSKLHQESSFTPDPRSTEAITAALMSGESLSPEAAQTVMKLLATASQVNPLS